MPLDSPCSIASFQIRGKLRVSKIAFSSYMLVASESSNSLKKMLSLKNVLHDQFESSFLISQPKHTTSQLTAHQATIVP